MTAVISTTFDDLYLFNLPIVTWCWNKLGVDVICFMPDINVDGEKRDEKWATSASKLSLIHELGRTGIIKLSHPYFTAPKHKEATYAQCLRNYAAALQIDENELIVSSDVDMILFKNPPYYDSLTVWGDDLVPNGQFPMCYITGIVKQWRQAFNINGRTHQQCIDDLLGNDECEHYRGNRWALDQEIAFQSVSKVNHTVVARAMPGTQFAAHRIDRDDAYWEERLSPDIIDAHLWRPGYTDENFAKILKLLQYFYPNDGFDWLKDYREQYIKLL